MGRMPELTRTEAETRARQIDVQHYSIDLDLTVWGLLPGLAVEPLALQQFRATPL